MFPGILLSSKIPNDTPPKYVVLTAFSPARDSGVNTPATLLLRSRPHHPQPSSGSTLTLKPTSFTDGTSCVGGVFVKLMPYPRHVLVAITPGVCGFLESSPYTNHSLGYLSS